MIVLSRKRELFFVLVDLVVAFTTGVYVLFLLQLRLFSIVFLCVMIVTTSLPFNF